MEKESYLDKFQVGKCPPLLLAPMEGVGNLLFRKALTLIGGFDEGCTEFLRVSKTPNIPHLLSQYDPKDLGSIPQAVQLMGSDPFLMGEVAARFGEKKAPRIDLNCGCPSNTVTGRGAGSSLLKDPEHLYKIASSMVKHSSVPVTIKMRAGYNDTSLFKENLLAAEKSGAHFITLHPRTKQEGYALPSHWERLQKAKELLKIPLVGSGDITTAEDAAKMLKMTACDALMIGRGALMNPWLFHEIRAHFHQTDCIKSFEKTEAYLTVYAKSIEKTNMKHPIGKLKQLFRYLFSHKSLAPYKQQLLSSQEESFWAFFERGITLLKNPLNDRSIIH